MERKPSKKQLIVPPPLPKEFLTFEKGTEGRLTFSSTPRSSESRSERSSSFSESSSYDYNFPSSREGVLEISGPSSRKRQRTPVDPRALEALEAVFGGGKFFNGTGKPVNFVITVPERAENGVIINSVLHGIIPATWGKPYVCLVTTRHEDGRVTEAYERRGGDEVCKCHVLEHRVGLADSGKYSICHIYDEKTGRVEQYDIINQEITTLPEEKIPGYNGFMDRIEEFPVFPDSQESRNIIILVPRYTAKHLLKTRCSHRIVTYFPLDENKSLNVITLVTGAIYTPVYTPIPQKTDPVNMEELSGGRV